ncbi:MAG TPA: ArsR family transcriptional regulator [Thermoanaerobaculia bacterium]|nr:ArsR family transcriptional regulator [Thermoanaerobaculia bacterium]
MDTAPLSQPPPFLKLIAHGLRWNLVEALSRSDLRVQELVELVGEPANLVSYHLRQLREQALVAERRSAADRRDVYYSLDLERLRGLFMTASETLHPGLAETPQAAVLSGLRLERRVRVLFLCTHNSARSQMAEALLRSLGNGEVEAFSAGTEVTRVHPLAVQTMAERGLDISAQRSKHLSEYVGEPFDYVITVCDNAREACPLFPGDPERIHWSIPDPAAVEGSEEVQAAAFQRAADELTARIRYLLAVLDKKGR